MEEVPGSAPPAQVVPASASPPQRGEPSEAGRRSPWPPLAIAGRLVRNLARCARDAAWTPFALRARRDWLVIRLERGVLEARAPLRWLARRGGAPPLAAVLDGLRSARSDPRLRGVLVRVGAGSLGWAQTVALAAALADVRAAGKRCVVYAAHTGNAGAWLGAQADAFWVAPGGRIDLLGVRLSAPYLRGALDRFRVRPRVIHAGAYKSAGEILERSGPSQEAREALEQVADDLYGALVEGLARGRAGTPERAREWIDGGPYLASEAIAAGLADAEVYADEIEERLGREGLAANASASAAPKPEPPVLRPLELYRRIARPRFRWDPLLAGRPRIAVVPLLGLVSEGRVRPLIRALRRLRDDASVRGVVLRVDSPGGDPQASDAVWRAVARLRERKPVVASFGDVAASGGYYAAVAANEIVAEPTTLTGSIGVVLMSLEVDELLRDLGIAFEGVQRGRNAAIYDVTRARGEEQIEVLRRQIGVIYAEFVRKVAQSRGRSEQEIEPAAQGRVWSGAQALRRGLVDALGGLQTAVDRVSARAGLRPDEGETVEVSLAAAPWARWFERAAPAESPLEWLNRAQLLCPIRPRLR